MFERQTMEQILTKMLNWSRGTTSKVTDFRVGSKVRTLYESIAVLIEELYDNVYKSMKTTTESNLYSLIDFPKLPATNATGTVTFSRTSWETSLTIPAGTQVSTKTTDGSPVIVYKTTADLVMGQEVDIADTTVVCLTSGTAGNAEAQSITTLVTAIDGVSSVSNAITFDNGQDIETSEDQKLRFQLFIKSQARGILQSVEYGATLATLTDSDGIVTERVVQAKAFEYLPDRVGYVDVYIWNGVGDASDALKAQVSLLQYGYYDSDGVAVYGYKPAGIYVTVYTVAVKFVKIKLELVKEDWEDLADLKVAIELIVSRYFSKIAIGSNLIQTALESNIKSIDGVKDVKLWLSINGGTTWIMSNIQSLAMEKLMIFKGTGDGSSGALSIQYVVSDSLTTISY